MFPHGTTTGLNILTGLIESVYSSSLAREVNKLQCSLTNSSKLVALQSQHKCHKSEINWRTIPFISFGRGSLETPFKLSF